MVGMGSGEDKVNEETRDGDKSGPVGLRARTHK